MFEGLVTQLLVGYLGRYIKDFQKEQLKITLWNEEVLLENVELILEAFDYLQLPVALKRGHIGRLSIRIPWKKLGWDPIIILLEDVFFCAGPRDDHEWSADAVEIREMAAKKAKLAAAELAKLSRRVCDNQAGQSLISHVTGRILDSIQVSMRNVHILYCEMQPDSMLFGLRFSSLTISNQNPSGPLSLKARGAYVSKIVEIHGLGIHCSNIQGSFDFMCRDGTVESKKWHDALSDVGKYDYIVVPFDVSFLVIKSGKLEGDAPQYSVTAEPTKLVMTISCAQLQHILELLDYINTCQLWEKYGRYRPWGCPLSKKLKGWHKVWWHYAQESVCSEVRKKLKKTSWRYLGQRLDERRKYVNLYKVKLNYLRKEQAVDQDVLSELELMEKDSDIDDILQFRSIAEQELEDALNSTPSELADGTPGVGEKSLNDEAASGRARGWLNWLSRGVLGAGGTDDSSQFSGVVSDEVIKDICEATKFQPMPSNNFAANGTTFLFAVNINISQMSLSMKSTIGDEEIADLNCSALKVECKVWEESTAIIAKVESVEIFNSSKQMAILQVKKEMIDDNNVPMSEKASTSIYVDIAPKNQLAELIVKVFIQPIQIYCDMVFLQQLMEFYSVLESHKSLQQRVLLSLNGIKDVKSRLVSKIEYVLSNRHRVIWDVNFVNISVCLPWNNSDSEPCSMVIQTVDLRLCSKTDAPPVLSKIDDQCQFTSRCLGMEGGSDILNAVQLEEIYDHYEVSLNDFQVTLITPSFPRGLSFLENFSAAVVLAQCVIPDELILKQLEVHLIVSSLHLRFSASTYFAFLSLADHFHLLSFKSEHNRVKASLSPITPLSYQTMPFFCSISAYFKVIKLEVNLENDGDSSSILQLSLQQLRLRYAESGVQDCSISVRELTIISYNQTNECKNNILCSSRMFGDDLPHTVRMQDGDDSEQDKFLERCFRLQFRGQRSGQSNFHSCTVHLSNTEFHCFPYIVSCLAEFYDKLVFYGGSAVHKFEQKEVRQMEDPSFGFQRFGLSNYDENEFTEWASIPLVQFPFVTMLNYGRLHNLESILIPDWRSCCIGAKNIRDQKNSNISDATVLNFQDESDYCHVGNQFESSHVEIDLNIANVDLHFHDRSGIVGSITLPVGKASVVSNADFFDVLCSVEGVTLFSSWWTYDIQKFLWGPALSNRSPLINIRARKSSTSKSSSDLEISFGIQHVCCIIPPEYLAVLIGYFSLPDWNPNGCEHQVCENSEHSSESHATVYKFEILESIIMSPVESEEKQLLKLEVQRLYCSFIQNDDLENTLYDIFSELSVSKDKLAENAHCLTIFGRDLSLSLLLLNNHGSDTLMADQVTAHEKFTLIQSFNFDLWLWLPDESHSSLVNCSSICIVMKIASCEIVVEDSYFASGFQALSDVVDQYSLVDKKSRCFTQDIPQFLQLKNTLKDCTDGPSTLLEITCSVSSLSFKLISSARCSDSPGIIAKVNSGCLISATMKDDVILNLDIHFSSLLLSSLANSVFLAKCSSDSSVSSVLEIHLSTVQKNETELAFVLPSLEIWLHVSDWVMVIDHLSSCIKSFPQASIPDASDSSVAQVDVLTQMSPHSEPMLSSSELDKSAPYAVNVTVKSENIGLSCHIPLWISEEASDQSKDIETQTGMETDLSAVNGGRDSKFVTITLRSRSSELHTQGTDLRIKTRFEEVTASVGICESASVQSWPFFQLLQLAAKIEICEFKKIPMVIKVDTKCEAFDVWLSHQVFYFWHGIDFGAANGDSSEFTYGSMRLNMQFTKVSILLTDGRWSCNGPLMELLMRNLNIESSLMENTFRFFTEGDLLVNYNNIHKVLWEPFVEPWHAQINVMKKSEKNALLDSSIVTEIQLKSTTPLNLNVTTSLFEVIFRATEMIKEARGLMQIYEIPKSLRHQNYHCVENLCVRRYASYTVHNMTSLPLVFHVYHGLGSADNVDASVSTCEDTVPPGSYVPIYIDGTLDEQVFNYRPAPSSGGFSKKLSNRAGHYFMTIQFEGTSEKSDPISMDFVGLTYFEVNFSKDNRRAEATGGFLVPVVFDVSVQQYSKLIQLYSTVIFMNSTSVPLELRFDIPFGMSSKIVDPIYPGEEFPLPLHLAEAGHMRWRPLGNDYLWSEVHNLSKVLSTESRSGFLRSLVCYPSHPSSYLFRCCLSVQDISLPLSGRLKKRLTHTVSIKRSVDEDSKTRFIHRVTLTTPLTVKNYLPQEVSVTIAGGGVSHTALLAEVEASFFHVDSSHDLTVTFCIPGFRPSNILFPRSETFSATAKPTGAGLSLTETMTFDADLYDGPMYVTMEKMMDSSSGARQLCISVPFLLYNCTGFALSISRSDHELNGNCCRVPSCYDCTEQGLFVDQKDGLRLLSSEESLYPGPFKFGNEFVSTTHIIPPEDNLTPPSGRLLTQPLASHNPSMYCRQSVNQMDLIAQQASSSNLNRHLDSYNQLDLKSSNVLNDGKVSDVMNSECLKAKPFMYSPDPGVAASEIMVRVSRCRTECTIENLPSTSWSNSFFLVAPSGSTTVLVPQPLSNSAAVISVTSQLLDGPLTGRTRAITFQPRYVISNACSKPLCYKQKGTKVTFHLGVGQHSHLHWIDTRRELLVAVRFVEPGWQWSGSFLPDHLGDAQVKMRNYDTGALRIIRVEVQNADIIRDEKIVGNTIGNSGTIFILLSDDDTGFVPYRVDNFSNETLRIYQQKCETLETIVYPYTSCPYAWDEPSYPHRLIVEVPGERIVGSYILDDVKEYAPVHLSSSLSLEKQDRTLLSSVHAEGAMKVLCIFDSSCHVLGELKNSSSLTFRKKSESKEVEENLNDYEEKISVSVSYIGVSLIDSHPQELLYASIEDIKVDLLQSVKQQRFSFQVASLQIDNQLRGTPYPVILSFHEDYKGSLVSQVRNKDGGRMSKFESMIPYASGASHEPVFCFVASKWRNNEMALVSFENISLRIAELSLELDLELLLKLLDFCKANPLLKTEMPISMSRVDSYAHKLGVVDISCSVALQDSQRLLRNGDLQLPKIDCPPPDCHHSNPSLPEIAPIGAPWQKIYLLARRQNKIYVESFSLAPVKVTLSFSSNPWMLKKGGLTSGESFIHRGIMAFADVEGAQISLRELTIAHHMASWESIQQILFKHYSRQFLHEMYKVFGSAGVIGNPMGFARRVGLGVKDFLSVPARGVLQSPSGLISGMAQGTSSLLSNTLYAMSDTATQFSKAAHKGILAFTFDGHDAAKMGKQRMVASSQTKGVINELLEGLTGLLQSPVKGAEKHGLPGVLSGLALGVTGLVAKPAASVLEATGRTAQSIRNRSRLHRMGLHHFRVRLPRYLSAELPLRPYSWEEAIGTAVLLEVDDGLKFKDEVLVMCKSLKDSGKFVVLTEKLILIIGCSSLADLGKPEFRGVVAEPEWIVEVEIALESVIHADVDGEVVHIVGSNSETLHGQNLHHQKRTGAKFKRWDQSPTPLPLFQTNLELSSNEDADYFLRVLMSTFEQGKEQGWGNVYLLHKSNIK